MLQSSSRRVFLQRAAAGCAGLAVSAPFIAGLSARAFAADNNYRALVCVYLGGGNDAINSCVPYDEASYNDYLRQRGSLAVPRAMLLPMANTTQSGRQSAFHPNLAGLSGLYNAGRLALVANVGNLRQPVTRALYEAGAAALPPQLFSHLDQNNQWQSQGDNLAQGWGGRLADRLVDNNAKRSLTSMTTTGGMSVWSTGSQVTTFAASENGAPDSFFSAGDNFDAIVTDSSSRTNLLEKAYAETHESLGDGIRSIASAILPESTFPAAPGGEHNGLAQQLLTVARLVGAQSALGVTRQVFFVELGGFDTHDDQSNRHPSLLTKLNDALVYFDGMLGQLGMRGNVTTFTMSEFGRTLVPNSDGTDHGWGSHHIVMGGGVRGGEVYGTLPSFSAGSNDFLGGGPMIPTLAAAQYGATLGKWLGVDDASLLTVFPDLGNFTQKNLGFLA